MPHAKVAQFDCLVGTNKRWNDQFGSFRSSLGL